MAKVLVAEDEGAINELILWNLRLVGHEADGCFDGQTALELATSGSYDLLLLDVMLPGLSGFQVKALLPKEQPVIFVTAKSALGSRLEGLGLGADDYIVKPFEMLELLARVDAVLRRTQRQQTTFILGAVTVQLESRRVLKNGAELEMAPREYELLESLIINRNLALSREKLLELVWGYDYAGDTRTVDVHIQRLRKKLGWENQIETVFKYGYRLRGQ